MRLNFSIPEFMRVVWVSPTAKAVWEPRLSRITAAWETVEREAVGAGLKPGSLQSCAPSELPSLTLWAMKNKLVALPVSRQGIQDRYTSANIPFEEGKPWAYRVFIGNHHLAEIFARKFAEDDAASIGGALGYPICCQEFFVKYWVGEGWRDLTYPMVGAEQTDFRVTGPTGCNILLRWLGVRLVSHLPCSFRCKPTAEIAWKMMKFGISLGFSEEMQWIDQMLSWPVRWSSLHGVSITTIPILKIISSSDALSQEVIIEREGHMYPEEGAKANDFPFRKFVNLEVRAHEYQDNGFPSREAMDQAHLPIITAATDNLTTALGKVIDLGCGNGILLQKINEAAPWLVPCGTEVVNHKIQRAQLRLGDGEFSCASIEEDHYWKPPYRVALISINRLHEAKNAGELLKRLQAGCQRIVIYSYGEWKHHPLIAEHLEHVGSHAGFSSVAHVYEPIKVGVA